MHFKLENLGSTFAERAYTEGKYIAIDDEQWIENLRCKLLGIPVMKWLVLRLLDISASRLKEIIASSQKSDRERTASADINWKQYIPGILRHMSKNQRNLDVDDGFFVYSIHYPMSVRRH